MGRLRVIAGLVAPALGVLGLLVIVGLSVAFEPGEPTSQIISGAVTAIASILAAYFGIKLGNDNAAAQIEQIQHAADGQWEQAKKAQVFARFSSQAKHARPSASSD